MAYATRAELRALDGLGDSTVHSDALLDEAILLAKNTVDRATGTSFGDVSSAAYDAFTVTMSGNGGRCIRLVDVEGYPILFARTISSVTIDGVADSGITYVLHPDGRAIRSSGSWSVGSDGGQNIVVVGTAGVADDASVDALADLRWCARSIARNWVLNQESRLADRALNLTTPEGSFEVRAQAGAPGRPTNLPDVNAVLGRHNHRWSI
jgi:hypothetical protein